MKETRQLAYILASLCIIPVSIVFKTWAGLKMLLLPSQFMGVLVPSNTSDFQIQTPEQKTAFWDLIARSLILIIMNSVAISLFSLSKKEFIPLPSKKCYESSDEVLHEGQQFLPHFV
jgi:hypothetical protein